jgi:hypothetical protein
MDRIASIVEQITRMCSLRRATAIIQALPATFDVDVSGTFDTFEPTPQEIAAAAALIEADWAKKFEPLTAFADLSPEERARWEDFSARNTKHLLKVPAGAAEALYVENHGETPVFIVDQDYQNSPDAKDWSPTFPRFTEGETPYVEEYLGIDDMPLHRIREMTGHFIEFPIPREVRVYQDGESITLSKGRAWPLWCVLVDGTLRSRKLLEDQAWQNGQDGHRVHLPELPNRCLLVEMWTDCGDDGHLQHDRRGFAVMTQVQFAEYLAHLANTRYRRPRQSELEQIVERFGTKANRE